MEKREEEGGIEEGKASFILLSGEVQRWRTWKAKSLAMLT
jgi:hypothetical protein